MKSIRLRGLAIFFVLVMLVTAFSACVKHEELPTGDETSTPGDQTGDETNEQTGKEENGGVTNESVQEYDAYTLTFTDNGDGTCYVSRIRIRPTWKETFVLDIPAYSPDGKLVTAVRGDGFADALPDVLFVEDYNRIMEALQAKMDDLDEDSREYEEYETAYMKLYVWYFQTEKETEIPSIWEELAKKLPIMDEVGALCILDSETITQKERYHLERMLLLADYTPDRIQELAGAVRRMAEITDGAYWKELLARMQNPNSAMLVSDLVLPQAVLMGGVEAAEGLRYLPLSSYEMSLEASELEIRMLAVYLYTCGWVQLKYDGSEEERQAIEERAASYLPKDFEFHISWH